MEAQMTYLRPTLSPTGPPTNVPMAVATDEQKAAAKEFLNWLVYSEIGQQMVVKTCSLIPPFKNEEIFEKLKKGDEYGV